MYFDEAHIVSSDNVPKLGPRYGPRLGVDVDRTVPLEMETSVTLREQSAKCENNEREGTNQYVEGYPENAWLREHSVLRADDGRLCGTECFHGNALVLEAGIVEVYGRVLRWPFAIRVGGLGGQT